jgi:S1-C subfamily serine protease
MKANQKSGMIRFSAVLTVTIVATSLLAGGLLGYFLGNGQISNRVGTMESLIASLQNEVSNLQSTGGGTDNTIVNGGNYSASQLYVDVKDSVVVIRGILVQYDMFGNPYYSQVQGSGFVYNSSGETVIVTNYHVVENTVNITVTFLNGDGYSATVLGSDPYADLAVLSLNTSQSGFKALEIVPSSTLRVGDPVIAVGTPYGLAGSMTEGIVSALGRTIMEGTTSGYPIAECIQTTTAINPGNSGGPLLDYLGEVVGITTAIISNSEGLGFATPSNTILREINSLIKDGSYDKHPWLGVSGTDMTYEIAQAIGTNVTYGLLITQVTSGSPADQANLVYGTQRVLVAGQRITVGGDIIIAMNTTNAEMRITGNDDFSTFLEEYTSPNQTVSLTIIRAHETLIVPATLEARPTQN